MKRSTKLDDPAGPRVLMYASKRIEAGEELQWDYGARTLTLTLTLPLPLPQPLTLPLSLTLTPTRWDYGAGYWAAHEAKGMVEK